MDGLHIFLAVLLGVVSYGHGRISEPASEITARPGDNITLYCDCKRSTGLFIVWYRNCSHENQPTLVFKTKHDSLTETFNVNYYPKLFSRFQMVNNDSTDSYDLLIMNITDSDEGLYYCGTEQKKVEDKEHIAERYVYSYGNISTQIRINVYPDSSDDPCRCISSSVPAVSWIIVFTPAFSILSSFLSFIMVYYFCLKTDKEPQILQKKPDTRGQTRWNQDEDVYLTRVVFRVKDEQTHQ